MTENPNRDYTGGDSVAFICPNCRGGFAAPPPKNECPWCGQALDGSYEVETPRVVSRVEPTDNDSNGFLGLFK